MGAVNCIILDDRAIVWTDGGQYDRGGTLEAIAPNCLEVGDQPMVLAAQNFSPAIFEWHHCLQNAEIGIDGVLEKDGAFLDEYLRQRSDLAKPVQELSWLIGWSAALSRIQLIEVDATRQVRQRIDSVGSVVVPQISEEYRYPLEMIIKQSRSPVDVDLVEFGKTVLKSQRQIPISPTDGEPSRYRIGGYIMQTEISAIGVRHKIIHNWPDMVGQLTDPFDELGL